MDPMGWQHHATRDESNGGHGRSLKGEVFSPDAEEG